MTNPILINVSRSPLVESQHRGTLVVVNADGDVILSLGDIRRPVFPRSAVKPFQALPLIESGAAMAFGYGDAEIALAAASHSGTEQHLQVAERMLAGAGLQTVALCCGSHAPFDGASARDVVIAGATPTVLHHNCSGKHIAMLATAVFLDEPLDGYADHDHPVQTRIRGAIESLALCRLDHTVRGVDGCAVPTWALAPQDLAAAFARFGSGRGLTEPRRDAARRIMQAAWSEPLMFAGPGRLDTRVAQRLANGAFVKTGAEGAYGGVFPELGLGFAVKIDDGATRASEAIVCLLIEALLPIARGHFRQRILRNGRGADVGAIGPSDELAAAVNSLNRNIS